MPSDPGQLSGHLGLADPGRAGEQEVADRFLLVAQAGARHLDGGGQGVDRLVLAEHHQFQIALQVAQHVLIRRRHRLGRDAGHLGDDGFDIGNADHLLALGDRQQPLAGAGLVDDIDRLVRQVAVVDVARRQLHRHP